VWLEHLGKNGLHWNHSFNRLSCLVSETGLMRGTLMD